VSSKGDLAIAYSDYQKHALMHGTKLGPKPKTAAELGEEFIGQISDTEDVSADSAVERGKEFVAHQSVLDNATLAEQIKAKVQSILDDVTGDPDGDVGLFGDPLIRTKIQSVLQDFYKDPKRRQPGGLRRARPGVHRALRGQGACIGASARIKRDAALNDDRPIASSEGRPRSRVEGGDHHKRILTLSGWLKPNRSSRRAVPMLFRIKSFEMSPIECSSRTRCTCSPRTRGRKYVGKILESEGQNLLRTGIREGVRRGVKRAGATAAVAALA
jgi:hypothetical protein